jgi:hypothetical protein
MFLELIATFFVGFGAAGTVLILNKVTRGKLSMALVPLSAGAAMIAFTIWSEYSWYPRTVSQLPEGVEIVSTSESKALYRPWTYVTPYVDRFAAVDVPRLQRNENVPAQVIVPMYFMGRWSPGAEVPVVVDCVESKRAPLSEGIQFDDTGAVLSTAWIDVHSADPLLAAVCG